MKDLLADRIQDLATAGGYVAVAAIDRLALACGCPVVLSSRDSLQRPSLPARAAAATPRTGAPE
ncbi:hypothetical protein [Methylobacterium sp. SD21]|uniref:hypothetical protein n=1 Tax=Methylobacterium litchii TaxID=3138810 RepID=UPI00313DC95F